MINLTLNQLKRPALSNLVPKFGTKVEKNDINKGGLSTEEVDRNITLPFELMREVEVSSSDTTTKIQYDAKIAIVGSDPVTLTLDKASYKGCVITITNRSTEQATIVLSEDNQKNIESKKSLVLEWDGTVWNDTALVVDSTVSEDSNKPVSSAAVYQKATEITEAYTQAIAGETTARSEAITAVEQKVTEEINARTQADTALGTRIDEEVEARTNADTNFTQQIEAIERLHATLIGPGNFVDTDGDTITVNDSNKSIRQIAHEEFYRQLITDAANVQSQIDTLKELADYLQTNPSVIADMYSKLGVTWSVDNLTDFGTFDFSNVLSATNVDDAVLELYNTFTGKIGELTSLATSAKDNIVVAVNELKTKIDDEVTARTQGDTALGNRITSSVGTLSSLTTTAKTNLVAAVNEVQSEVNGKLPMCATTMLDSGFISSAGGYISLKEFWEKLVDSFGISAVVNFHWYNDEAGYVSLDGTASTDSVELNGCTIVYSCNGIPSSPYSIFRALVLPSSNAITRSYIIVADTAATAGTLFHKKIYPLAFASDVKAASNTYHYTFVVDSNAALTAWANNDRSGGQDYTSVLIRKGTWTSTKGVNLTDAGTKVVVGEAGSKLVFYNVEKGLYYDAIPTEHEYYMRGVTVEITGSGSGFYKCTNLTNCSGSGTGTGRGIGVGFMSCTNLTNCAGTGTGASNGYGFKSCMLVSRCKAGGHCFTNVFDDSYASSTKNSTYACADTPEGGFNNTTNPPA